MLTMFSFTLTTAFTTSILLKPFCTLGTKLCWLAKTSIYSNKHMKQTRSQYQDTRFPSLSPASMTDSSPTSRLPFVMHLPNALSISTSIVLPCSSVSLINISLHPRIKSPPAFHHCNFHHNKNRQHHTPWHDAKQKISPHLAKIRLNINDALLLPLRDSHVHDHERDDEEHNRI